MGIFNGTNGAIVYLENDSRTVFHCNKLEKLSCSMQDPWHHAACTLARLPLQRRNLNSTNQTIFFYSFKGICLHSSDHNRCFLWFCYDQQKVLIDRRLLNPIPFNIRLVVRVKLFEMILSYTELQFVILQLCYCCKQSVSTPWLFIC